MGKYHRIVIGLPLRISLEQANAENMEIYRKHRFQNKVQLIKLSDTKNG